MANYSFSQLESLWINAGGPKVVAPLAAAIALAESSGDPNAVNATDPNLRGGTQTSWGLWQISNGTHNQPVPNILNPQVNAQQAVAKYTGGGNTFKAWGTYNSGAYKNFLPAGYVAPTSANVPATAGQGTTGSTAGVTLASFSPADILDPFQAFQDAAKAAGDLISGIVLHPGSVAGGVSNLADAVTGMASTINALITDSMWLFKPSHWVRIAAFGAGVFTILPGVWMLSKAGKGEGDISLALGIFLVVLSGVLFFVAFHSLPVDVRNLSDLASYMSKEIRANSPATTG